VTLVEEYIKRARYRCESCGHIWIQRAGPTQCPRCECLMVRWLNHPLDAIERGEEK